MSNLLSLRDRDAGVPPRDICDVADSSPFGFGVRRESQDVSEKDLSQHSCAFHKRKPCPDAPANSTAEGQPCVGFDFVVDEATGSVSPGVGVAVAALMSQQNRGVDDGACG